MVNDQGGGSSSSHGEDDIQENEIRDIHALNSPRQFPPVNRPRRREAWETSSQRSSTLSSASEGSSEIFSTMSREFNALVLAGSAIENGNADGSNGGSSLPRIGEEDREELNPLAIVPDNHPMDLPSSPPRVGGSTAGHAVEDVSLQRVKKEETETKISAWQTAKVAKINNRFKREDAIINGWESEEIQRATTWMKKIERRLEEKRAKALEKMQNDVAKARRKAEEKRASAEAKRGTKVARVLEIATLMRAVGRPPAKRSFF